MKEAALLQSVDDVVGRVEVEHELLRRTLEARHEGLEQHLVKGPRPPPVRPVLQTAKGRRVRKRGPFADHRLQREIVTQVVVVVLVLIAARQSEDPLLQHRGQVVHHALATSVIGEQARDSADQPQLALGLTDQQEPAVRRDMTTLERGLDLASDRAWKRQRCLGTICHGGSPFLIRLKTPRS